MAKGDLNAHVWFRNAAKSLGYATRDLYLKDSVTPALFDTYDTNKMFIEEIIGKVKDSRGGSSGIKGLLGSKAGQVANTIREVKSNVKSDLKSGIFYDPKRDSGFGDLGDDFDMNFDIDYDGGEDFSMEDMSDSFDNSSSTSESNPVAVVTNINSDNPMVKVVQAQSTIISGVAEAQSQRDISLADARLKYDEKVNSQLFSAIGAINQNIGLIVDFNSNSMYGYVGSSLKYYEDSLSYMEEMITEIRKINEYYAKMNIEPEKDEYKKRNDVFGGMENVLDLEQYTKLIKTNFDDFISSDFILSNLGMMKAMGGMKPSANILSFVPKFIINSVIPNIVTETLTEFDKTYKSFVPAFLSKLGDIGDEGSSNYFINALSSIFGLPKSMKKEISPENYTKSAIPFDGVAKKSIVEVIPTYLSKILSAITGKSEMLFDYDKGVFKSRRQINKEFEEEKRFRATSTYNAFDIKNKIYGLEDYIDNEKRDRLTRVIDDFLVNVTDRRKMFNPKRDSDIDDILPEATEEEKRIIKILLRSLPKSEQMELSGIHHIKARNSISEYMTDLENAGISPIINKFNRSNVDGFSLDEGSGGLLYGKEDKFGKRPIDYIREIKQLLIEGIGVKIISNINRSGSNNKDIILPGYHNKYNYADESEPDNDNNNDDYDFDEITKTPINDYGLSLSDEELQSIFEKIGKEEKKEKSQFAKKISDFIFGDDKDDRTFIGRIVYGVGEKLKDGFTKVFSTINNTMYDIVFGYDDPDKSMMDRIKESLDSFYNYLKEKIYEPLHNFLFGENGLVDKFKKSDFYNKIKDVKSKASDYLFGTKDNDGNRSGGLFSDTRNEFKSMTDKVKLNVTGVLKDKDGNVIQEKSGSVFEEARNITKEIKTSISSIFTSDKKQDKDTSITSEIADMFRLGAKNFTDVFFGVNKDTNGNYVSKIDTSNIIETLKERAPKTLAGGIVGGGAGLLASMGGFGILGSLFLGPFSGIAIGMGASFLSQSETFKNWLFGEYDEETEERVGGFINKSTQKFLSEHKNALIAGATLGSLKGLLGIGILPSFILGGPISGAIFGLASSFAIRSEVFQNFLFGKDDGSGNRAGGLFNNISGIINSRFDKSMKEKIGTIGVGALGGAGLALGLNTFGLLGSLSVGPLGGAILGASAGIIASSESWREKLFGKFDEKGKKTDYGLFGKLGMKVSTEIIEPMKIKFTNWSFSIQEWFERDVADPFLDALQPFREEFTRFKERAVDFFVNVGERLHIPEIADTIKSTVKEVTSNMTSALKFVLDKSINTIGKVTGIVLSSPAKAMEFIANKFIVPKHMRDGLKSVREAIIDNIKQSDFVVKVFNPIKEKIDTGIDWVQEKFSSAIKGIFSFSKKVIKSTFKGIGKIIMGVVSAPFKMLSLPFKTASTISEYITKRKVQSADASVVDNIKSGNRGFVRSLGDLAMTFVPGSKLRTAAMYTSDGAYYQGDRLQEREDRRYENRLRSEQRDQIRKEMAKINKSSKSILKDKKLTDAEKDELLKANRKKLNDILDDSNNRIYNLGQTKERKDQLRMDRKNLVSEIKQKLSGDPKSAVNLNYDELSDVQKQSMTKNDFERIKDKYLSRLYGKEYKSKTNMEKDVFKSEMLKSNAIDETAKNTKSASEYLKSIVDRGIKVFTMNDTDEDFEGTKDVNFGSIISETERSETNSDYLKYGTHGETVYELNDRFKQEDEAEKRESKFSKLLSLVGEGNEERRKQNTIWDKIFGKKGLITAGILAALPAIMNFLKDPFNFTVNTLSEGLDKLLEALGLKDDDGDRTNSSNDTQLNNDMLESLARGGAYIVTRTGSALSKAASRISSVLVDNSIKRKVSSTFTKYGDDIIDNKYRFANASDDVTESVMRSSKYGDDIIDGSYRVIDDASDSATRLLGNSSDDIIDGSYRVIDDVSDSATRLLGNSSDNIVSNSVRVPDVNFNVVDDAIGTTRQNAGIISKFKGLLDDAISKLSSAIATKFPKLKSALSSVTKVIKKAAGGLTDNVLTRFIGKITNLLTRLGLSWTVVVDATTVTYGLISGSSKTEAANLFQVNQNMVDTTMRTISSFIKGFVNYSWFFVIDVADDILESVSGTSFISLIAKAIYKALYSNDEKALDRFELATKEFKSDYNDYTLAEELMKGNVQLDENGNVLYLDSEGNLTTENTGNVAYKDGTVHESVASYNDRVNQTVMSKGWGKFKTGVSDAWTTVFGKKGNSVKYNDALEQKKILENAVKNGTIDPESEGYKTALANVNKTLKENESKEGISSVLIESLKTSSMDDYKQLGKDVLSDRLKGTKIALMGDGVFSNNYWSAPKDDTPLSPFRKIFFYSNRVLSFPLNAILNLGAIAWKGIQKLSDKMYPVIENILDDMLGGTNIALNGDGVLSKSYWSAPNDNSDMSPFRKILFYTIRTLNFPMNSVIQIGKNIYDGVKPLIDGFVKISSDVIPDVLRGSQIALMGDGVFSKDYWTIDDGEADSTNVFRRLLFYSARTATFLPNAVLNLGSLAWKGIKKIGESFATIGSYVISDTLSGMSTALMGDGVLSSSYWTIPESEGEASIFRKVLFYNSRITSFIPNAILNLGSLAWKGIKKIGDGLASIGSYVINDISTGMTTALMGDGVLSSSYWTIPESEGEASIFRKVLFYNSRITSFIPNAVLNLGSLAWKGIKKIGDGFASIGSYVISDTLSGMSTALMGDGVLSSSYWTLPESEGETSIFRKIMFYNSRITSFIPNAILNLGSLAWKGIKKIGDGLASIGSYVINDISTGASIALNGDGVLSSSYWSMPESSGTGAVFRKMLFYKTRMLFFIPNAILNLGSLAWKGIKAIGDNLSSATDVMKTTMSEDVTKISSSNYWKIPSYINNSNSSSGINKTIFYIARGFMYPKHLLNNLFDSIAEKWKDVKESITEKLTNVGKTISNAWDKLKKDTSSYFNSGGEDEDIIDISKRKTPIITQQYGVLNGGLPNTGGATAELLNGYKQTSQYGNVRSTGKVHKGIDLVKSNNAPIYSFTKGVVDGVVKSYAPDSGSYPNGPGFGNYVRVLDDNGKYNIYGHLNKVNVSKGQTVNTNTILGLQGHTGNSTGSHLHYEVRNSLDSSSHINPLQYLQEYDGGSGKSSITSGFKNVVNSFKNITTSIVEPLQEISDAFSDPSESFMEPLKKMTSTVTSKLSSLLDSFIEKFKLSDDSSVVGNSYAEKIWNYFTNVMKLSKQAAAGIMGNLEAESGLNPINLENKYNKSLGYTDDGYTKAVDNGRYTRFANDSAGYGLAQWTYKTRKQKLLKFMKDNKLSIGDLAGQLNFLNNELSTSYASMLSDIRSAKDVKTASDIFMTKFERPADQSSSAKSKRAKMGQRYYDAYGGEDQTLISQLYGVFNDGLPNTGGVTSNLLNTFKQTSQYGSIRSTGKVHNGIDLVKSNNAPIYSFTKGVVDEVVKSYAPDSGTYPNGPGYGNYVRVLDDNGRYNIYGHLNKVNVSKGQTVDTNTILGLQGHTGNSTGSHLHYEVRNTKDASSHINPLQYLQEYDGGTTSSTSSTLSNATGLYSVVEAVNKMTSPMMEPLQEISNAFTESSNSIIKPLQDISSATSGLLSSIIGTPGDNSTQSNSTTITSTNGTSKLTGGTDSKKIWNYLVNTMKLSKQAAAGIMGNLEAESGLNSKNLENKYNKLLGYTDEDYTKAVDNGSYTRFAKDSAGYGIAQWTYETRKQKLLNYMKANNLSIGDLAGQLDFLNNELTTGYPSILADIRSAKDVKTASDIFMTKFERPADQSSSAKSKRAKMGQTYYDAYGGVEEDIRTALIDTSNNDRFAIRKTQYNNNNTKIASNSGIVDKIYDTLTNVVNILSDISMHTKTTSKYTEKIANKHENVTDTNSNNINNTPVANVVTNNNTSNNPIYEAAANKSNNTSNMRYSIAKAIAAGIQ